MRLSKSAENVSVGKLFEHLIMKRNIRITVCKINAKLGCFNLPSQHGRKIYYDVNDGTAAEHFKLLSKVKMIPRSKKIIPIN